MTDRPGRQMGRAAALMMGSVLLSRILGYARDAVIAWQHGATTETDAYFVAFTIPDFLNYLLAGGSLSITFIPIFARYLAEGKEEEGSAPSRRSPR
jgi:putative peptidoglycan lipid II flippase